MTNLEMDIDFPKESTPPPERKFEDDLLELFKESTAEERKSDDLLEFFKESTPAERTSDDVVDVSKESTPAKRTSDDIVVLVSPGASGYGLPYAPVDWPNPGDIWGWRVGWRIKGSGSFQDRFLLAPERFQRKPGKKLVLDSKAAVVRFLNLNIPDADVNAFFASFSWEIPANGESSKRERHDGIERPDGEISKSGRPKRESTQKVKVDPTPQPLSQRKKTPSQRKKKTGTSLETNGSSKRTRKATPRSRRLYREQSSSSVEELANGADSYDDDISQVETEFHWPDVKLQGLDESQAVPENFDNFLNSLDEIMTLPLHAQDSGPATSQRGYMTDLRDKLSSLLAMDFSSLVASNKFKQLTAISSKLLQCDPTLNPTELSMLKLIQEIPLAGKNFLEAEKLVNQADKFFVDLDAKVNRVTSLKNEYNVSKEQLEISQANESSSLLELMEIDHQIAKLQSRRAEISRDIQTTSRKIVEFSTNQKKVMELLPKIVHEVQMANCEKDEWELKKKRSAEQVAEITAKFAPLHGFSFQGLPF